MANRPRPWTVLPHDPIERLEQNLWAVEGTLPRMALRRRMSIVRLGDGRLLFHNAVPLRDADMAALEAWGRPALLVVPNGSHRLDVHAWKVRYPRLAVLCPAPVRARVAEKVQVDGVLDELPAHLGGDASAVAEPLQGSRIGEVALAVRSGPRVSLLFGDTLFNVPHTGGFQGAVLRLVGSSGGPRVTRVARLLTVSDRGALAAALERLAETRGLARLVPSHGQIVSHGAREVLRAVALRLRSK